jgi:hypothetical protein
MTTPNPNERCRYEFMDWHKGGKCTACPDAPTPADPPDETLETLRAEVSRLTAERDAAREDARRWRWFRSQRASTQEQFTGDYPKLMDAAIDSAMTQEGEGEQK